MIRHLFILLALAFTLMGCGSSVKVTNTWKGEPDTIEKFKQKNVLVIARMADNQARTAFESELSKALNASGIKATESFKEFPRLSPREEVSEERAQQVLSMIQSEGFDAIVLTTIKDKRLTTQTNTTGMYVGAYGGYPGYYGGFNRYYGYPYAYGPYYGAGAYVPTGSTTSTYTTYVLETLGFNLDEPEENQLVFVVTTELGEPNDAYKTAEKYVTKITEAYTK